MIFGAFMVAPSAIVMLAFDPCGPHEHFGMQKSGASEVAAYEHMLQDSFNRGYTSTMRRQAALQSQALRELEARQLIKI
jgi:hypothetical protein